MSITGALSNALSGLTAASRSAEVVASNIANAMTEGYATRSLSLSSRQGTTGGVRIDGIIRSTDPGLLADRRLAESGQAHSQSLAAALTRIEGLFGTPLDPGSLTARLAAFETSLVEAASRPEAPERLNRVAQTAAYLAGTMRDISDGLQALRTEADRSIVTQVRTLNTALEQVQQLNARINFALGQGFPTPDLLDQRQAVIDQIARIVPVIEVPRDRGAVALFTPGGAILLDGPAAQIGFDPVNQVAAHMTQSGGLLSGLTINGVPLSTDPASGHLRGGSLDAAFRLRDDLAVSAQSQLDAVARDLIERFGASGLDPSVSPGQPGLFADGSALFDPAEEVGLAGRIALNALVDPAQGGASWRLRDGIGAAFPGPPGEGALLNRMLDALTGPRLPASGGFAQGAVSAPGLSALMLSGIGSDRQIAEQRQSFASSRATSLRMAELERGVDTDDQLQRLMVIERAYAANARVVQTVDDMIQTLLRI